MDINEDDLDFDGDVLLHLGHPLNGTLTIRHENGLVKEEIPYLNGFQEGCSKEWDKNGRLIRESNSVHGSVNGTERTWHINGTIKSHAQYSKGVELCYEEWNETGMLTVHRELGHHTDLWKYAMSE